MYQVLCGKASQGEQIKHIHYYAEVTFQKCDQTDHLKPTFGHKTLLTGNNMGIKNINNA